MAGGVSGTTGAVSAAVTNGTGGAIKGAFRAGISTVSNGANGNRDGDRLAFRGANATACKIAEKAIRHARRLCAVFTPSGYG
jgi:hypothetical protein